MALLLALAAPAAGYVAPPAGAARPSRAAAVAPGAALEPRGPEGAAGGAQAGPGVLFAAAASVGAGAVLGWLNARRQQAASGAAAAAVALSVSPLAATAIVEYDGIKYLGGTDKVDINNANVQAFRQFPGMYPTAAGAIATHGPYKSVADIYNIPGLDDRVKEIMKKYEGSFVCLPPSPAYVLDRINNGMYR